MTRKDLAGQREAKDLAPMLRCVVRGRWKLRQFAASGVGETFALKLSFMLSLPPITLRLRGWKLIDRVALAFLLLCSIALGAACGLLFVYASDLPEIRALETYRPNVVTEIYADDGQMVAASRCSGAS